MLKKRIICGVFALILAASCMTGYFNINGEEVFATARLLVTYENLNTRDDFSADSSGLGASYLSSDSKVKVVGNSESVMGSRSLAVNRCDMRWWSLDASDEEMYLSITVKTTENFRNTLNLVLSTKQPSGKSGSSGGNVLTITRQEGRNVLLDASGNVVKELEQDVRYSIKAAFKRGSSKYDIYVNGADTGGEHIFACDVYSVESMELRVSEIPPEESEQPGGTEQPEQQSDSPVNTQHNVGNGNIENPYILIDNPGVSIKGRSYPQKYSSQEPGPLPEVKIPAYEEYDSIRVYINTTRIAMSHAPVERDSTVYVDIEQIARCIGMNFEEDNSNKTFHIKNENADIKGTLDGTTLSVNDRICEIKAPPRKIDGTVMVSPNFINEAFNAKVWWDEAGKMLVITTGENKKDDILKCVGGMLYMNGEPYYEISFNKFDLFYQIMSDYVHDGAYPTSEYTVMAAEAALKQLNELGFESIRVFVYSNAFPCLMYDENAQKTYFEAMDVFFDLCDKYDIKVVVCLGLIENYLLKNEYVDGEGWITSNETVNELVADPDSESRQNVYKYLDLFINRYKDRKSVLMWEIRNEGSLEADVGEAVMNVHYSLLQLAEFYGDCADKIRSIDNKHLITSGDSVLRNAQWNLFTDVMNGRNLSWKTDTAEERLKALALLNEKLDVISAHAYGLGVSDVSEYADENGNNVICDFDMYVKEAALLGKAFYNGETNGSFSFDSKTFYEDTQKYIDSIIDARVQLSHWWTFRSDRQGFNDGYLWRIDSGELLDMIVEGNRRIKEINAVNKAEDDNTSDIWDDPAFNVFDPEKVIDGSEFVASASFRSKMIRLAIICGVLVLTAGCGVFALTREKLKKKRKKDIV